MAHRGNGLVWLVAAVAGLGGLLFGFDSSVVADIRDLAMAQLVLDEWQWSQVVSASLLGAIPGIPLSGFLADRISRKTLLKGVAVGFVAGSVLCAIANGFAMLCAGRLLTGFCIGVASFAVPLYIAEIAPARHRGGMVMLNGLAITGGQAIAYLVGWGLHDVSAQSWRWLFAIGAIPGIILFVGMFYVPHSPRWLMLRHGMEHARKVLLTLRDSPQAVEQELADMGTVLRRSANRVPIARLLAILLAGCTLGAFQQLSGINAILYYGPVIFDTAGFLPVSQAILATFVISLVNCLFTAVTLFSVDRIGRRAMLLGGTIVAGIGLFAAAFCFGQDGLVRQWGVLACLSLYVAGYCVSVGSLFRVMIAEIFPLQFRGLAMSIAAMVQWATTCVISLVFLAFWNSLGSSACLMLFGVACLAATAFIALFVPETAGIPLETLEQRLASGVRLRNIGRPLRGKPASSLDTLLEDPV